MHLGGYYEKAETNIVEIYVVLTEIPWEFIRMRNVTAASPRFGVSCKWLRSSFQEYLRQ